ncbi:MAG: hypothetical protein IH828_10190, partial [Nitrospinae bacterium]|nr:hypothetical protein [Nitrospinota bacterium]
MRGMKGTGMITNGSLVTLASALVLALAGGQAQAAVLKVPADFATIQAAVDTAASGDTVKLKKKCVAPNTTCGPNGEYQEVVDIDKKITLNCNGAVLDGAVQGDASTATPSAHLGGPGINIMSDGDGTTVVNCTVQNFEGEGIEVDDADGVT